MKWKGLHLDQPPFLLWQVSRFSPSKECSLPISPHLPSCSESKILLKSLLSDHALNSESLLIKVFFCTQCGPFLSLLVQLTPSVQDSFNASVSEWMTPWEL